MYLKLYLICNIILIIVFAKQSYACNGYVMKVHYIKTCNDKSVIKFINSTATLDKDCNIIPKGCIYTDGFQTAMVHYRAEKKPLPVLEGDYDLCDSLQDKQEIALLAVSALGLSSKCPMEKVDKCSTGDKKLNISKYKSKLGLAVGVSELKLRVRHDNGETCVAIKTEFSKPRRRG